MPEVAPCTVGGKCFRLDELLLFPIFMGLRCVRYEFHHNFREMSSVVISHRTKDCFGTSHLFRGPHIVSRGFRRGDQLLPAYRTYCWDYRKLNTEQLLFTEGGGG